MRSNRNEHAVPAWSAELSRVVRDQRKALGLTQSELADLAGCGTAFLYSVENGKPSLRLDKLLEVLNVLGLRLVVDRGQGGLTVTEKLQ